MTCMDHVTFKHPGTFMSPEMTRSLKDDVKCHPTRTQALEKLIKETPLNHVPRPMVVVDIGYGGTGAGHAEATKDGEMAISAAILYWATRKKEYVELSLKIIRAWATTNTTWRGDNALLEASWTVCSMARAAELIKHSEHKALWMAIEPAFFGWLDRVIMPVLKSDHIWKWQIVNNWHFSQICARMQIAILREDQKEWRWCIEKFPEALNKALLFRKCEGETSETCRDVTHNQMQLGGFSQAAEMAYHQGNPRLYDARMIKCFELQASIMMRELPTGLCRDDIKAPYGFWYEPVWHIAYHHFVKREGRAMPKTAAYIKTIGADRVCFHWGPNCLTHFHQY